VDECARGEFDAGKGDWLVEGRRYRVVCWCIIEVDIMVFERLEEGDEDG